MILDVVKGKFLNEVKKKFKKKILTGSDISKISVQNAKKNTLS